MNKAEIVSLVRDTAKRFGIDESIAVAQIKQESGFNPNARSSAGALGVAQFMPATARRFGLTNPRDPRAAMDAWGKYMTFLLKKFGGDYRLALAGYNAGEGNVMKHKGVPPFKETRNYVARIMSQAKQGIAKFEPSPQQQPLELTVDAYSGNAVSNTPSWLYIGGGVLVLWLILKD
jgi:soluble lytic murein transglycosylase-like protein